MTIETRLVDYTHGGKNYQAFMAWNGENKQPRPGILVSHAWAGRTEFENAKAVALAQLGFVGFALDLYGAGVEGQSPEENAALMQPFLDDRDQLQDQLQHGLGVMKNQDEVDQFHTAAIGFCFGGLCVLDMARYGADLHGVASFHGLFMPPESKKLPEKINTKILALHGYDDPMATPDQMVALGNELTKAQADWQIHAYGRTVHAFTNPEAKEGPTVYSAKADRRSWAAMNDFMAELFDQA